MKSRWSNPKATGYDYYGGKGITVCPEWRNSFVQFLSDMGRAATKFHSIDRIDPTGGYEPSNCRWATPVERAGNKGVVALVVGFRVPADKHDLAVALESRGAWSLGIGIAVAAAYWLYRRLVDY